MSEIRRREFISLLGSAAAWPRSVLAQATNRRTIIALVMDGFEKRRRHQGGMKRVASVAFQREDAMKVPRRTFLHLAAGAAALPAFSRIARAQAYPARPVRLIVG